MTARAGPALAIIGHGPRALWALESLEARLRARDAIRPSAVHIFGPGDLGAGDVYDVAQPPYLRLNVDSTSVDVWRGKDARGPSFDTWREVREPRSAIDKFPPRRLVGSYLRDQACVVVRSLRLLLGTNGVNLHQTTVNRVVRRQGRWQVDDHGLFDEVLLAVGHAQDWPGALIHDWPAANPPLQPRVFPVSSWLNRPELRPGATVVVRGAALTAIDAALALTVGRGVRPAESDLQIMMVSRTGKVMRPKTDDFVRQTLLRRAGDVSRFGAAVQRGADVPEQLRALAAALLPDHQDANGAVNAAEVDLFATPTATESIEHLKRGIAIAQGQQPPDGAWAFGQAWIMLYGELVRRQQRTSRARPVLEWPGYARWSRELERLAFGPPLVNARLLLAAVEAGRIVVCRGDVRSLLTTADLVVDAVLAPPGIAALDGRDLLGGLRDQGILSQSRHGRGAAVGPDASVLDASGAVVQGLALVGRATEDVVIGNDTLRRDLHPAIEGWARRITTPTAQCGAADE